jgi:hypothetical protein
MIAIAKNTTMPLLPGNTKLGASEIWQWGLPAELTCPGASPLCLESCYAKKHRYRFASVQKRLDANNADRMTADWADRVIGQIAVLRIKVIRIHTSGDFDTADYIRQWERIAKERPNTRFFAFTRSWAVQELRGPLKRLAALPNFQLWLSADASMRKPPRWRGTRIAFMSTSDDDSTILQWQADMVFRTARKSKRVTIDSTLVCPRERSRTLTKPTCESCRLCFDRGDWLDKTNARLRLPVLV